MSNFQFCTDQIVWSLPIECTPTKDSCNGAAAIHSNISSMVIDWDGFNHDCQKIYSVNNAFVYVITIVAWMDLYNWPGKVLYTII